MLGKLSQFHARGWYTDDIRSWQEIRQDDIGNEKEKQEEALMKLTTREREIRTQIEDLSEAPAPLKTNAKVVNGASSGPKGNGRTKHSKK